MPGRHNPTLRQRRLGAELRRMREQAGLGGSELARALGVSPAQVTQLENGKSSVSADRLRTIAAACKCASQPLVDALAAMATDRGKGWWEKYREVLSADFLDVAEIEGHATRITTFTVVSMPGLLQTSSYASAMFKHGFPPLPQHEADLRTAFRLQRQRLVRSGEAPYSALIHEAALRIRYGGAQVLAEQLDSLVGDSEHPSIAVRVVPFDTEHFPGPSENLTYAQGPVPELDTAQADSSHGSHLFDSPVQLASYRVILERIASAALSEDESRDFIRSVRKEIKDKND
ncbi:helix-turn-helix domain-containing protein [Kitasatospora sp. NPDC008050]|uniref:helix-turn-helix domain-containing protein n=1 Tax=Kitasatospora sp. NPDC008050 TaxID=3364021 RepID=UPI0036E10297